MFTEALDPPDFGRIGHPALTVALRITSREPRTVEDHPETPTSTVLIGNCHNAAKRIKKKLISSRETCSAEDMLNNRLIDFAQDRFVDSGCQKAGGSGQLIV
jgi:hypothetical protein